MEKITKFIKTLIISFTTILIIHLFINNFIIFNETESLEKGIYFAIPCNKNNIQIGDIVFFKMPENLDKLVHHRNYINKECHYFLKKVGGLEGNIVANKENKFYINSQIIGEIFKEDSLGNKLPQIKDFIISKGNFVPIGTHRKSFDGRYFGEIPLNLIEKKAFLLFSLK